MIVVALVVLGLCLGSFVNALIWRVHEQEEGHKKSPDLSIFKGRSMCPNCRHELAIKDLVPLLSWLGLGGKCRYCGKPISGQYPLVEAATAAAFVFSYAFWPVPLDNGLRTAAFATWLLVLTGLAALIVYDAKWMLLPNRIVYPLSGIAGLYAILMAADSGDFVKAILNTVLAVAVGGGIFYVIFHISKGKWIGGGDVKLGWLLGLVAGTPGKSLLFIFVASLLGSLVSVPLLGLRKLKKTSVIPFGPFLIAGAIIAVIFGGDILEWYRRTFINF